MDGTYAISRDVLRIFMYTNYEKIDSNTTSKRHCSHCVVMWTKGLGDALFIIRRVNFFYWEFQRFRFLLKVS